MYWKIIIAGILVGAQASPIPQGPGKKRPSSGNRAGDQQQESSQDRRKIPATSQNEGNTTSLWNGGLGDAMDWEDTRPATVAMLEARTVPGCTDNPRNPHNSFPVLAGPAKTAFGQMKHSLSTLRLLLSMAVPSVNEDTTAANPLDRADARHLAPEDAQRSASRPMWTRSKVVAKLRERCLSNIRARDLPATVGVSSQGAPDKLPASNLQPKRIGRVKFRTGPYRQDANQRRNAHRSSICKGETGAVEGARGFQTERGAEQNSPSASAVNTDVAVANGRHVLRMAQDAAFRARLAFGGGQGSPGTRQDGGVGHGVNLSCRNTSSQENSPNATSNHHCAQSRNPSGASYQGNVQFGEPGESDSTGNVSRGEFGAGIPAKRPWWNVVLSQLANTPMRLYPHAADESGDVHWKIGNVNEEERGALTRFAKDVDRVTSWVSDAGIQGGGYWTVSNGRDHEPQGAMAQPNNNDLIFGTRENDEPRQGKRSFTMEEDHALPPPLAQIVPINLTVNNVNQVFPFPNYQDGVLTSIDMRRIPTTQAGMLAASQAIERWWEDTDDGAGSKRRDDSTTVRTTGPSNASPNKIIHDET